MCEYPPITGGFSAQRASNAVRVSMLWRHLAFFFRITGRCPRPLLSIATHRHQGRHRHQVCSHYADVIMIEMASQITSLAIVYSIVYSDADQRKHQSSASLAFVRGNHRGPVNSPRKWPVTRKCFHLMTSSCVDKYSINKRMPVCLSVSPSIWLFVISFYSFDFFLLWYNDKILSRTQLRLQRLAMLM